MDHPAPLHGGSEHPSRGAASRLWKSGRRCARSCDCWWEGLLSPGFLRKAVSGTVDVWRRRDGPGANADGGFRSIQALLGVARATQRTSARQAPCSWPRAAESEGSQNHRPQPEPPEPETRANWAFHRIPAQSRKYITDDALELCGNPSMCPNSWTAAKTDHLRVAARPPSW